MTPPAPSNETVSRRELSHAQALDEGARRGLIALCELAADIAQASGAAIIISADDSPGFVATIDPGVGNSEVEELLGTCSEAAHELPVPTDAAASMGDGDDQVSGSGLYLSGRLMLETAGQRIGTLFLLDKRPRNLPRNLFALLQHVATAAVSILASHLEAEASAATSRADASLPETRAQLRRAIGNGEFVPLYQPNVELKWGRIVGFEILARWQHPTRGLLSPDEFRLAICDRSLTPLLTRALLNAALKDGASWRSAGLSPGRLAINVGSGDLMSESFAEEITNTLDMYGFAASDLVIEVTEGIAMGEPEEQVHKTLSALRERGVRVVLDDFGTGFAGLQHLRNWPIDGLKLDRDFVRNCLTKTEDQIIIRSVVQMCHDLELDVVAEGIEDNAQYLFLSNIGCDFGQGFYFGKPSAAADVPALLRGDEPGPAAHVATVKSN